jgi:hypothetical protein
MDDNGSKLVGLDGSRSNFHCFKELMLGVAIVSMLPADIA